MATRDFKKAFSLIELIFVIVIIGIISAVAIPKLFDSRSGAIATTVQQDISTITSSIQSYHMVNGSVDKIIDTVNINSKTWNISDKKVEFKEDNKVCVSIEITNNKLNVNIDNTAGTLCQKIYDNGIRTVSYDLM
jgi:general secretion pathway protein G